MTDKTKIILMYAGTAVLAVALIGTFTWLRVAQENREKSAIEKRLAIDVGRAEKVEMARLEKDLTATNQAGEEVSISQLKDKVWVATQFFAECPNCAARNGDHLVDLYKRYQDNPDFQMVCVSVDPETDDVERLQEYAVNLGADISNWWFLTGDRETLHHYMEEEMKFLSVRERTNEDDIAREGRFAHDMGVAVFGKGLVMREKKDLLWAREQSPELYEHFEQQLTSAIDKALAE
ncbi:SCO family protein [Roseibacillus persicicus]|uniref:SCO family protein n=1 Tax=Roseibacillus persicicus TaxID=454148 RepID=UPI00280EA1DE|nr:SCO family protein [Roseibacillus persicicus]MDQ8190872.1 SCO family protein [Roseibacillus persicicus]